MGGSLLKRLVYTDSSGNTIPWVAENPDKSAPWGLGCLLCRASEVPSLKTKKSAFVDFTFGDGTPGLCIEALIRHGRHWRTNSMEQGLDELQGRDHAEAAAAANVTIPPGKR